MSASGNINNIDCIEFLTELLKPASAGAVAWVAKFDAAPGSPGERWGGKAYAPHDLPKINGSNAYYSVGAFPPDAQARRIETMEGTHTYLLDDIGQKVLPAIPLAIFGEPSFKIQTSPNSQQWGYMLERMATAEEAAAVHRWFVSKSFSDKNGLSAVRYGRLPAGVNNKPEYSVPFRVHGVEWHPGRRFAVEFFTSKMKAEGGGDRVEECDDELERKITSGEDYHDPLVKLAARGQKRGFAESEIISSLEHLMLKSADRSDRWQARFRDIERTVKSAAHFRPPERPDAVLVHDGSLVENVQAVLKVLELRGVAALIFMRGKLLVRPYLKERIGFNERPVESLELKKLDSTALAYELGQLIAFKRVLKNDFKLIDCPPKIALTALAVPHEWSKLHRLDVIVSAPIYLGNGRLLSEPGYHAERCAWLTVPPGVTCAVAPTRAEAEAALLRLKDWIAEFPFASGVDEAVMLAAMMTAALRPSIQFCPGFVFDAPEYGSGKTTAAEFVHLIGFGRLPAVLQFLANDEETRKQIDAAQIEGRQSLVFDNVPTGLIFSHAALAQTLTAPERSARELGNSTLHDVPCNQLVLVTGNNITVGQDITRRVISCRLDPHGNPTARTFKRPDLLKEVMTVRVAVLSDLFTLVAAYEASGQALKCERLVSYERWCRWVQQPLVWLGCADPVLSVREQQGEDPERAALERIVQLWNAVFGSDWVAVKKLVTYDGTGANKEEHSELIAALGDESERDKHGMVNRGRLGWWLRGNQGRWIAAGLRIERKSPGESNRRSIQWRVVRRQSARGIAGDFQTEGESIEPSKPVRVHEPGDDM